MGFNQISRETIYKVMLKKRHIKEGKNLLQVETSLRPAEERLAADPSEPSLEILEALKMKYDSHFGYIAKGAIINGLTVEFCTESILEFYWRFTC